MEELEGGEKELVIGLRKQLAEVVGWLEEGIADQLEFMKGKLHPKDMEREYFIPEDAHEILVGELVRFALITALHNSKEDSKEAYALVDEKLAEAKITHQIEGEAYTLH